MRSLALVAVVSMGLAVFAAPGVAFAQNAAPGEAPAATTPADATSEQSGAVKTSIPVPTPPAELAPPATAQPSAAPTIDSPPHDVRFIGSATTTISGTRGSDQDIRLLSPVSGHDPLCDRSHDGTTTWSCPVRLPSGSAVVLKVIDQNDSSLSDRVTIAVLASPTVTGGAANQAASDGRVRGTGYPGASVTVTLSTKEECRVTVDPSGAWLCQFTRLSSGSRTATATQQTDYSGPTSSNRSASATILFDLDRPAAPTLATPRDGADVPLAATTYSGAGEDGATVTVYAGPLVVCTAVAANGAWSCSAGGVPVGRHTVRVGQQDVAGNPSPGSRAVSIFYVDPALPETSSPTAPPTEGANGGQVTPTTPSAPVSSSPAPSPSHWAAAPPGAGTPDATPPPTIPEQSQPGRDDASPAAPARVPGGWDDPTLFTAAVAPPGSGSTFLWLQAVLLALGAVLLLAAPARLLAGTLSRARDGRQIFGGASIAGRNRAREEFEVAPTLRLNRWLVGCAALVAAAALVMLSGPVVDQPAYLRLFIAVVIAVSAVNAVAVLVPRWWGSRVLRTDTSVTFLPRYLLLVAVGALVSRVFEIHPALLFGLLGSVAMAGTPTMAKRGQLAAVRASCLMVLALLGWLLLGALGEFSGFAGALGAEIGNSVVLASIGSAAFVLIPVGNTSGRSILAWSPVIWTGLAVLAFTVLFGVLSPAVGLWHAGGTLTKLWVIAGAFAALSVATWAWQRYVAPALR